LILSKQQYGIALKPSKKSAMDSPATQLTDESFSSTELSSGASIWVETYESLQLKSCQQKNNYCLEIEGKLSTLFELGTILPMNIDLREIVETARTARMSIITYDGMGSHVLLLAKDYARISHVMPGSERGGFMVYTLAHMGDILLAQGWKLKGKAAHQGEREGSQSTIVETWIRKQIGPKK